MKDIFLFSCFLSQIFLLVKSDDIKLTGRTVQNTLKCYQCDTIGKDPNAVCHEEDLKTCPNDYAADRCLTSTTKNATGYYHIVRKCALAPCDLQGIQSSLLKLSTNCDRSTEEYNCFTCCEKDGCNLRSSSNIQYKEKSTTLLLFGCSTLLLVALHFVNIS